MQIDDATLITIASGVSAFLVKALDLFYNFVKNKTSPNSKDNRLDDAILVTNQIFEIVSKFDQDGVPMVYIPRRFISQMEDNCEHLRTLIHNSNITPKAFDKIANTLENMTQVLIRLEDRSAHNPHNFHKGDN
jgi:hypothetical protein